MTGKDWIGLIILLCMLFVFILGFFYIWMDIEAFKLWHLHKLFSTSVWTGVFSAIIIVLLEA